jgi:hypothetical protein
MRLDGSSWTIWVSKSIASGQFAKAEQADTKFSLPFTVHLGKVAFISGRFSAPYQRLSLIGVPKHLNILKIYPISDSP